MEQGATERVERVTTLELFFDLVFVFTITQLTTVLSGSPNAKGLLRVVLMSMRSRSTAPLAIRCAESAGGPPTPLATFL